MLFWKIIILVKFNLIINTLCDLPNEMGENITCNILMQMVSRNTGIKDWFQHWLQGVWKCIYRFWFRAKFDFSIETEIVYKNQYKTIFKCLSIVPSSATPATIVCFRRVSSIFNSIIQFPNHIFLTHRGKRKAYVPHMFI